MTVAILDSTVLIHIFRRRQAAVAWFNAQPTVFSVTSITWMELMVGVTNKRTQADTRRLLNGFETVYVTDADQAWAMQRIEQLRFSHGIGMNDCLIAAVAHRLQVPLYTHNLKHMTPMIGPLAVQPYT